MGNSSAGVAMTRRRSLIAALVAGALGLTLVVVGLAYWLSGARHEQPAPVPQNIPANVHQQLSGYTFTRSDGGRRIFTIHAARTVAFKQGGATVLEEVLVELFGRSGSRHDILRTHRCDYNAQSGDLFSSGAVEIELNAQADARAGAGLRGKQRVVVRTSKVSFQRQGSEVVSDEPVEFHIGPARGSARGLVYATREGSLELKQDVTAEFQPGGGAVPQPLVKLSAARLRYDKEAGQVKLWGPIEITQGERRVDADEGTCFVDDRNRLTRVELQGRVRGFQASNGQTQEIAAGRVEGAFDPATGQLRQWVADENVTADLKEKAASSHLVAQHLELAFSGVHPRPQRGAVSGNVRLAVESSPADPASGVRTAVEKKTLEAEALTFEFRPDGKSLRQAQTAGAGTLVVAPSDPRLGARVITAGQFLLAFNAQSRLENLQGTSPTRIVFEPPANAPKGTTAQESRGDRLDASFDPATRTLQQVDQIGNFEFHDGDRQATAERARYDAPAQSVTLIGKPRLWDADSRMQAEHVRFDLRTDTAEGEGRVQASHLPPGKTSDHSPANEPTNVVADRVFAERRSQFVRYEGHVRAWHGVDVVESDALDVYRTERRVKSGSEVLTSHLQPASLVSGPTPATPPASRETRPVTIRADRLDYFDQGRKASYHGHVQLQTEDTRLQSDRLDVFFSLGPAAQTAEVERAVGDGHVQVVQPGRHANGEHAEYDAATGKIVLTGGPPSLYDAEKGFTSGRRLTFYIHDDRLFVDGGDESQTLSKHRVAQ